MPRPAPRRWGRVLAAAGSATASRNVRRVYVDNVNSKRDHTVPRTADDLHTNPSAPPKWLLALKNQFSTLF